MRLLGILLALFVSLPALAGESKPTVVSLDSCADQLLLALGDDNQILALSPSATGPFSFYLDRAKKFPSHHGTVEEILLLHPDIVLSTGAGDPGLVSMLDKLGVKVVKAGLPNDIEDAIASLKAVSRNLSQAEKGARLAQSTEEALSALESQKSESVTAVYMSPSGITTGSGTFLDQVLSLAGLDNLVADEGIKGWSSFNVESFVALHPDVLVTSFFDSKVGNAESWRFSEHPAVRQAMDRVEIIDVPSRYVSCPAWYAVEGAAYIRNQLKHEGGDAAKP